MHLRQPRTAAAALAAAALLAASHAAAQPDVVAITRRASPAVVTLHTYSPAGRETGLGSGFFLPDGRIATNRHVVEGSGRIDVKTPDDRTIGSVQYAEAVNGVADLAILPRIGTPPATLPIATHLPDVGETVIVIGAPEGLSNTVSTGIVSSIRRVEGRTLVQISAPISHGSSGGPVLNARGEVIGVSVSILSEGQNLNFAVPATELLALSRQPAGRISFAGNLRGGGSASGRDVESQDVSRLPRIAAGQTVSGRLTPGDFLRPDRSYADSYVYNGRAGEQITVLLRSSAFDAWLVVRDPGGGLDEYDDDSGGNYDSQLTLTLPRTGPYLVVANSVGQEATGPYTLTLRSGGAGGNLANVPPGSGGTGTIADLDRMRLPQITAGQTVTGQLSRSSFRRSDDGTYANGYAYQGRAGEQLTITMRSRAFDSWLVIDEPDGPFQQYDDDSGGGNDARITVTLPRSGRYVILANAVAPGSTGSYALSVQRGGGGGGGGIVGGGNSVTPIGGGSGGSGTLDDLARMRLPTISAGQTVRGQLTTGSFHRTDDGTYADGYIYYGRAGEQITVTLRSSDFDSWVVVHEPGGGLHEHDDDSGGGNDSQLTVTLPRTGRYLIVANAVGRDDTGSYTLRLESGNARMIRPIH